MSIKHNTVYPVKYMVSIGDLLTGYTFYGPFSTHDRAWSWTVDNMHVGSVIKIVPMFNVRDEG